MWVLSLRTDPLSASRAKVLEVPDEELRSLQIVIEGLLKMGEIRAAVSRPDKGKWVVVGIRIPFSSFFLLPIGVWPYSTMLIGRAVPPGRSFVSPCCLSLPFNSTHLWSSKCVNWNKQHQIFELKMFPNLLHANNITVLNSMDPSNDDSILLNIR